MITIMGIDQSLTSTGVVVLDVMHHQGKDKTHVEVEFAGSIQTKKTDKDFIFDTVDRANQVLDKLLPLLSEYNVKCICFESPSLSSAGNATRTLPLFLGVLLQGLLSACKGRSVEFYHIAPSSLKKVATGSGRASKVEMFEQLGRDEPELYKKLTNKPKNIGRYDICDAYFLASQGYDLYISNIKETK